MALQARCDAMCSPSAVRQRAASDLTHDHALSWSAAASRPPTSCTALQEQRHVWTVVAEVWQCCCYLALLRVPALLYMLLAMY
jgi:hypothetical protein